MKQLKLEFYTPKPHVPFGKYPRDFNPGELAYTEQWASIADSILSKHYPEFTMIQSRIIASFVCWLGSACGLNWLTFSQNVEYFANNDSNDDWHFIFDSDYELLTEIENDNTLIIRTLDAFIPWLATEAGKEFISSTEKYCTELTDQIYTFNILKEE